MIYQSCFVEIVTKALTADFIIVLRGHCEDPFLTKPLEQVGTLFEPWRHGRTIFQTSWKGSAFATPFELMATEARNLFFAVPLAPKYATPTPLPAFVADCLAIKAFLRETMEHEKWDDIENIDRLADRLGPGIVSVRCIELC